MRLLHARYLKRNFLEFIRPHPNSIFNVLNSLSLTHLTRLCVGLSPLRDQKFRHNFRYSLSPIHNCGEANEPTKHYLLHCSNVKHERQSLPQKFEKRNPNMISMNESSLLTQHLLYGYIMNIPGHTNAFPLNYVID